MLKFAKTLIAAGILTVMATVPALADEVIIKDNGAQSDNTAIVKDESSTVVLQGNATNVVTVAEVKSDSGDNTASENTSGNTTVKTGDATSELKVKVDGSENKTILPESCGCPDDDKVVIKDNGFHSTNKAVVKDDSFILIGQGNLTGVLTLAKVKSDTGDNAASGNTGGNTKVKTGKASSTLKVKVGGNKNILKP